MVMSPILRVVPMAIAIGVVIAVRVVLMRRQRGQTGPRSGGGRQRALVVLLPVVMIGMATLSGAFSAVGTLLGLALAPVGLGAGVALAMVSGAGGRRDAAPDDLARPNNNSVWIFVSLVAVRMLVVLTSTADRSQSVLHTLSSDLLLVSVGMAATRIGMALRVTVPRPTPAKLQLAGGAGRGTQVVVIGAGIAGLCLAQGLKRAGVSVTVYEKGGQESSSNWLQGYQIHINAEGSRALLECLPSDARERFEARALQPSQGVQILTPQLEVVRRMDSGLERSNPIVRSDLRAVLLQGLDDVVQFRTEFTSYERIDSGRIKVNFEGGTSAECDVLVGADGIRSAVRAQYLPQAQVREIGLVGAAGKLPIDGAVRSYLPASVLSHLNSVTSPDGLYMIVTHSIHKPPSTLSGRAPDPRSDDHDHIIWVLVSAPAAYGNDPRSIFRNGPALQSLVIRLVADWHPSLIRLIAETDAKVISATALQASNLIEPWEPTQVTVIGDAIHTMPPLRGLGGSTALRDAALLCRRLIEADRGKMSVVDAIRQYEAEMRDYGYAALQSSLEFADMLLKGRFEPRGMARRPHMEK